MLRFLFLFVFLLLPAFSFAEDVPLDNSSAPIVLVYETGGKESDGGFVDMARAGAERAREELGLQYREHILKKGETRADVFTEYAKNKASLIIAIGFQNVQDVAKVAPKFPATSFTVIDGMVPPLLSNVQSIVFRDKEGAFLVGAIAAMHNKSGKLGFIGGMDVPIIRDFANGFEQGAHYINPRIEVLRDMIGTSSDAWCNPASAGILAQKQIAQGADILFAAAGGSSIGMLEKVAQYPDVKSIGVDFNQNSLFPASVLTSLVKRVDKAVFGAMKQRSDNSWRSGIKYLGIKEGALDFTVDSYNAKVLKPATVEHAEMIKDYIISGTIRIENSDVE